MGVDPKGEFEVTYFGGPDNPAPNGGINYSVPYTSIPPNDLAPGTVNTHSISGFLTSSPWVASSPYTTAFSNSEYVIGTFDFYLAPSASSVGGDTAYQSMIVTNIGIYITPQTNGSVPLTPQALVSLYTWVPADLNSAYLVPGQAVSFLEINGNVYLTGLMLTGIYVYLTASPASFQKATGYVSGRWLAELSGRMVVAQTNSAAFSQGDVPAVQWSGVGVYGQAWDGNPAHDVWNPANQAFFNGNIGGFNLLSDVPDQITGVGLVGQSLIIVRNNGLTQQDPNSTFSNSGIQPYNWYHMWSSQQGVGGYVNTVAQYGQTLVFRSYDNVYSLSMSGGLTPLAQKFISKIMADQRSVDHQPGVFQPGGSAGNFFLNPSWNFASIYNQDGQLHYILTLNAYYTNNAGTAQNYICYAYDLNMSEGSWHFWDFSQYFQSSVQGAGFLFFSCPLVQHRTRWFTQPITLGKAASFPTFLLIGCYTSMGTLPGSAANANGNLFQLVAYDYDILTDPYTSFVTALYPALSLPSTSIFFRGETLALGHKITTRRLRILADNSNQHIPGLTNQQQAQVIFIGPNQTSIQASDPFNMRGDANPGGGTMIRTYYGDLVMSDEMVQPELFSYFNPANAWPTLCAFRIASVSLIGVDTTATTQ